MKKIVLLDFGGTLDGDGAHWSAQYERAFAAAGVNVTAAALREAFLESDRRLLTAPGIDRLGLDGHVRLQVDEMLDWLGLADPDRARQITEAWLTSARECLARAQAALLRHSRHLRYGIVSNFTGNLPLILAQEGLAELFDCVIVSETVRARKPEAAIFRLALEGMAGSREGAAMVGDSLPSDIRGAKAVGLTTVWLCGEAVPAGQRPCEADHVARDVAHALDLLAEAA